MATGKSKVALVFSILTLYMVGFGPDTRVNFSPKFWYQNSPISVGLNCPQKRYHSGLTRFGSFHFTMWLNNSATSLGVEALTLELSPVAIVIVSGTFLCFNFTFRTNQKRFRFDFKFDSISTNNASLHSQSLRLISDRRDLNFSLKRLDALCFSFWRIDSFLLMRFIIEPLI